MRLGHWCALVTLCSTLTACGGDGNSGTPHTGAIQGPPPPSKPSQDEAPPPTVARVEVDPRFGTGWVYSARQGLVVTAFHIVDGARAVQVVSDDIDPERQSGEVIAAAPCENVALIQIVSGDGLRPLRPAPVARIRAGQSVVGLGWENEPGTGMTWKATHGRVIEPRIAYGPRLIKSDKPPVDDVLRTTDLGSGGRSGGPVLDARGRLLAMNSFRYTNKERHDTPATDSIRVDRLFETLTAFRRGRAPGWIGYGLTVGEKNSLDGYRRGVVVTGIPQLSGGYTSGGVFVTAVAGRPVGDTMASWCRAVAPLPSKRLPVTFIRNPGDNPETQRVLVNVARRPE